jgi:O-antigen/teichoic acid export membrane protein
MFGKIKRYLQTATARQSAVTSFSTITNAVLGAVFYFLLARLLGAFDYGIFSLGISLITTLSGVFDLGSDQSLIMFLPKFKKPDFYPYLKLALIIKLLFGTLILLTLVIFSHNISSGIFHQPSLQKLMPLIGLGVITQLLFSFSTSVAQSFQRYYLWGALFIGTNLTRLILLISLYYANNLNVTLVIIIYILLPLLGFVALLSIIKIDFIKAKISGLVIKQFFSFNKWITGFVILSAANSRLDVFFVARYISLSAVGIYSLCLQIVSVLPQLTSALGAVTSPKFSSFTTIGQNIEYVKKTSLLSSLFALCSALILIPLSIILFNFSGASYLSGFTPFMVLLVSSVIFLITTPIRDSLLYFFGKPMLFFFAGVFQIILYLSLSPFLMLKFSIIGASFIVLINIILSSLFYSFYYLYLINEKPKT